MKYTLKLFCTKKTSISYGNLHILYIIHNYTNNKHPPKQVHCNGHTEKSSKVYTEWIETLVNRQKH